MAIKPSVLTEKNGHVKITKQDVLLKTGEIIFYFRYLDLNHEKFNYNGKDVGYFHKLIERLRDVSQISVKDIGAKGKSLRCHPIDWSDTTETCFGIPGENELVEGGAYQFEISQGEHGRIHGFFIGNIFCVRWLDPNHKLYKIKKRSSM